VELTMRRNKKEGGRVWLGKTQPVQGQCYENTRTEFDTQSQTIKYRQPCVNISETSPTQSFYKKLLASNIVLNLTLLKLHLASLKGNIMYTKNNI